MKARKYFAFLLCSGVVTTASGQYPEKPIKIIVPFAAGGVSDILARIVAHKISEQSGKTIVVENRGGAGGRIGYEAGAKSPADGYTLVATDVTYAMMPALYTSLPWEHSNLAPMALIGQMPFVVAVNVNAKSRSMVDLLALARANPGTINYGSSGIGAVNHVVTELFRQTAGIELTHVPYRGMGEAMGALIGGSIDFVVTAMPTAMGQVKSGKAIALSVTAPQRAASLPNVPTTTESGVAFVASNWVGFTTPKSSPREAFDWIQKQVFAAASSADIRDRIVAAGVEPQVMNADEFGRLMQSESRRWSETIRSAKIRAE